jgi:hypothetical protein
MNLVPLILEKAGAKVAPKDARDELDAGAVYPCELIVSGTVCGESIEPIAICGQLQVGHDGTFQKQVNPDAVAVVAHVLAAVPKTRRAETCGQLVGLWLASGELAPDRAIPVAREECVALAQDLIAKLTYVTACPKRGAVSFEFQN